jgi:hypothetical protein
VFAGLSPVYPQKAAVGAALEKRGLGLYLLHPNRVRSPAARRPSHLPQIDSSRQKFEKLVRSDPFLMLAEALVRVVLPQAETKSQPRIYRLPQQALFLFQTLLQQLAWAQPGSPLD